MESKFRIGSYLIALLGIGVFLLFLKLIICPKDGFTGLGGWFFVTIIIAFAALLLLMDLRTKALYIIFDDNGISSKNYFGFGKEKYFRYKELDGFYTSKIRSRTGNFNYTYIMKDGKKVIKISNQYHINYDMLFISVLDKLDNMGFIKTSFFSEIKDAITFK